MNARLPRITGPYSSQVSRRALGIGSLAATLSTLTISAPAHAWNDEQNGHISWLNRNENMHHTMIFVHGRSDKNHSPQRYILDNPSLSHFCKTPELNPWEQYRCAMRQDVNSYWRTVGSFYSTAELTSYFGFDDVRQKALYYDFRTMGGSCSLSLGDSTCSRRNLDGGERLVIPNSSDWMTGLGYAGYVRRSADDALVPGNFQSTHLRNVVFVGYYGDSDPAVFTHIGLDGQPNQYLIDNAGPPAQAALDRAMWEYCANGQAEWNGEQPWKSCSIVCHSAGCLATGMYLANGWGPGSPYHNDRDSSDPLFAWSGLTEVFSLNSAAGGSRLADLNDGQMGGVFEAQTPMTNAMQRSAAMGRYVHGQQLGGYSWVPTYYLGADNRMHDYSGHNMNRFFSDDFFFQEWDNTTPNDGAVTGRSQCGGNGTKDVAEDGEGDGTTQGRSCAWFAAEPGRQYGENWYNLMELCRSYDGSCRYDYNLDGVSWKSVCAYDDRKQMCNKDHSSLIGIGVQIISDLY